LCTHGLTFESNDAIAWDRGSGPAAHTRDLSLQIGNAERIDRIGMSDWEAFAEECGFTQAFVRRRVRKLAESVGEHLQPIVDAVLDVIPAAEQAAAGIVEGISRQVATVSRKNQKP
jgi:hypothetical protein